MGTTTRYFHEDQLNSTNVTTDYRGNVIQTLDYYPFGTTRINQSTGSVNEGKQYVGQYNDSETSLNYLQARYYKNSNGQFLNEDQMFLGDPKKQDLTNPQSLNSYSYANNNPIAKSDPSGKNPYLMAGLAAYDATVVWDFGRDVTSNVQNPAVPWYSKLTPQDPNAATRYNEDAYGNAATAMLVVATAGRLSPLVASGVLTQGGANVISVTVGGLGSVANAYLKGDLQPDGTYSAQQKAMIAFEAGYFGSQAGQQIPNPPGANPTSVFSSVAGAHALIEQYRAQADQATEALFQQTFPQQTVNNSTNSSKSNPNSNSSK